jgi:hypothetical protein
MKVWHLPCPLPCKKWRIHCLALMNERNAGVSMDWTTGEDPRLKRQTVKALVLLDRNLESEGPKTHPAHT